MKQHHENNIFIDKKQFSLASSRGKPPIKKNSITIILKTKLLIPATPIYTKYIYTKEHSGGRSF